MGDAGEDDQPLGIHLVLRSPFSTHAQECSWDNLAGLTHNNSRCRAPINTQHMLRSTEEAKWLPFARLPDGSFEHVLRELSVYFTYHINLLAHRRSTQLLPGAGWGNGRHRRGSIGSAERPRIS